MKIIKQLTNDIAGNIDEARDKIKMAYELKAEWPDAATWYREMANAHLGFNQPGHATVKKIIEQYKDSEAYKRNPVFADGMLMAWEAVHNDLISRTAEVKAMIEGYK